MTPVPPPCLDPTARENRAARPFGEGTWQHVPFSFKKKRPETARKNTLKKERTGSKRPFSERKEEEEEENARTALCRRENVTHLAFRNNGGRASFRKEKTGNTLKRDNDAALFYILAVWST